MLSIDTITELRAGLKPKGTEPIVRLGFINPYYDHSFVMQCLDEIEKKMPMVMAGIDEFTSSEELVMQLLNQSSKL